MTLEQLQSRLLDADIRYLIRTKARQLCRTPGFARHERDDLEQELTLRLLQRLRAFDSAKASFYCFALVVLDRVAIHLREARSAACRSDSGTISLESRVIGSEGKPSSLAALVGDDERSNRVGRYTASQTETIDTSIDVQTVVAELSGHLQELSQQLVTANRTEIAQSTGLPLKDVRRRIRIIGNALEEAGLKNDDSLARPSAGSGSSPV